MKKIKGFTLIELMIVVAIIGILAAIAIPKFADLIRKSKEGSTKGSLGALRSAMTIYYGEMEGVYPGHSLKVTGGALTTAPEVFMSGGPFLTKYLESLPVCKTATGGHGDDATTVHCTSCTGAGVGFTVSGVTAESDYATANAGGRWGYCSLNGVVMVSCSHTDTRGTTIGVW